MENNEFAFDGCVYVYLQGSNALWVHTLNETGSVLYSIGSINSPIHVQDNRKKPFLAVQKAMNGERSDDFADIFNKPAKVHLQAYRNLVEIVMEDCSGDEPHGPFTLWMGILEGDKITANPARWQLIKRVDKNQTAFAILVP